MQEMQDGQRTKEGRMSKIRGGILTLAVRACAAGSMPGRAMSRLTGSFVLLLSSVGLLGAVNANAATCTSIATGNWSSAATWSCVGLPTATVPGAADAVVIAAANPPHTVTVNVNSTALSVTFTGGTRNGTLNLGPAIALNVTNAVTINPSTNSTAGSNTKSLNVGSGTLTAASISITSGTAAARVSQVTVSTGAITTTGSITFADTVSAARLISTGASTINIGGNLASGGTLTTSGTGTINFNGAAPQAIGSYATYNNLTVNNAAGATLSGPITASGTLTLGSGSVTTGANTLTLAAGCPGSISRTSGYVIGNLQLTFPGGNSTCTYHVGDSIGYAPITVAMVGATAGTLTGRADAGDHPDTISSSSGIDATKSANHYWTLTAGTLTAYTSYSADFQFCADTGSCVIPTELDAGANTGNFIVARKISGAWSTPTVGVRTSYSTQATGITSANGFGEFAVGGVNLCFSDSFAGVLGSSWSVGSKSGSFTPAIVSGRLRLTEATTGQATWATLRRLIPAAGNKVTVEFDYFAYGGTGADGVAVVFSDASEAPVAGAFGGSLGYAQKSNPGSDCVIVGGCPGFAGGWLGIALDEYGNFSNPTEGRNGGPGLVLDSVSIRGSGAGVSGYRFLQGTTTLSPGVDGNNVPPGTVAHRYRIIIDHTDSVHTYVSVERDTTSGAGPAYTTLISPFDATDPGYSQGNMPASFNLSHWWSHRRGAF